MSRRRKAPAISPWLSARADNVEKRFIQVGDTLLMDKTFQSLSPGAKTLYCCMAMESRGRREFLFPRACALKYGFAEKSFRRYITELEEHGFLIRHSMKNLRRPNEYSFSFVWKGLRPASPSSKPMVISSISESS